MEPNTSEQIPVAQAALVCPVCHEPVLPQYYFCPNCGTKLQSAPLSTTVSSQVGLYAFSIILPVICFIFVNKWQGMKYIKSQDPKAKQIGQVAWALLILSTILTIWFVVILTQDAIQSSVNSINSDFSA